jgi:hypothetical protein
MVAAGDSVIGFYVLLPAVSGAAFVALRLFAAARRAMTAELKDRERQLRAERQHSKALEVENERLRKERNRMYLALIRSGNDPNDLIGGPAREPS